MSFDVDWPHGHVTADGRKARIVCRDLRSEQGSIVAAVMNHTGSSETVVAYFSDGKFFQRGANSYDLSNAPAPKKRFQGWVNVYAGSTFADRKNADLRAGPFRVACIPIDVEEGEGL